MNNFLVGVLLSSFFSITSFCFSQVPQKEFLLSDYQESEYSKFEIHKTIPKSIRAQALIALSYYPELRDISIVFKLKETRTPLTSRPRLMHIFKAAKKRTYLITISTKSNSLLDSILFKNLPFNAQIGVLGHEIAHIAFYINKSTWQMLGVGFGQLSKSYTTKFEYDTDMRFIEHGLGHQLYDWSSYVRKVFNLSEYLGPDNALENDGLSERYMNPDTIINTMKDLSIYE